MEELLIKVLAQVAIVIAEAFFVLLLQRWRQAVAHRASWGVA
jgi:predicted MFS family arabinose efflux permease